jgi:hypothetical protein
MHCTATEALRTPEARGTGIGRDCLDRKAHPAAASIT